MAALHRVHISHNTLTTALNAYFRLQTRLSKQLPQNPKHNLHLHPSVRDTQLYDYMRLLSLLNVLALSDRSHQVYQGQHYVPQQGIIPERTPATARRKVELSNLAV